MQGDILDEINRQRLRWHGRRGLLELDLFLQRFLATHLDTLAVEKLVVLQDLLLLSDHILLDLFQQKTRLTDEHLQSMVELIRTT
jgi:succinate dehydrogenase flavin-adding protein (antitoxin of CptAB toxin-antitoxin module)